MFFLGYTSALGGNHSMDATVTNVDNITSITLSNQICDNLFVTKNISSLTSPLSKDWNYDTYFDAQFKGNLQAGNIDYLVSSISAVRVKLREKGTYDWINIADVPITKAEDLSFTYFTNIARGGNTLYEGALTPVVNGAEGNLNVNTVNSNFDGIFICEKDKTFSTLLDIVITSTRNRPSAVLVPINSKYPVVIHNGEANYETGTTQATFILQDENGEFLKLSAYQYRHDLKDFLYDGQPKLMKYQDGQIWIIDVNQTIPDDSSEAIYEGKTKTTFNWVEIADAKDNQDLYDNNLIDVNPLET